MEITTWRLARASPGAVAEPASEDFARLDWTAGTGPGTAASMLRESDSWSPTDAIDFDDDDWWFRADLDDVAPGRGVLEFDGLATIAEVWLNGKLLFESDNMFVVRECAVDFELENELVIVCRSLKQHLAIRRRRPQWKTRLVSNQQLRWVRTTLLGRMPGWSPGPAPVGPWRPVRARSATTLAVSDWHATSNVVDGDGVVDISCRVEGPSSVDRVTATVGQVVVSLDHDEAQEGWTGRVVIPTPRRWFPHTHGEPALHQVSVEVVAGNESATFDQPPVGFRELDEARWRDDVRLVINDVAVFARGACWIPPDVVRMWSEETSMREALRLVVDAGMNLLRVPGTTVYEQPLFHRLCDELGIMVWQDFMFANMQYPIDDEGFRVSVDQETTSVTQRLAIHPSTVVMCGGSEVEQQAAMVGASTEAIRGHELGRRILAERVAEIGIGVLYVPNSPFGGHLPFSVSEGISHYFGVGAYLQPLEDARFARVRFASECLAIANVPDEFEVDRIRSSGGMAPHTPVWKAGVPRDGGTGWDFDDVRDHYLKQIFGIDPLSVRYGDPDRYLQYSRVVSYLLMERTISEWRRPDNLCAGSIVLQLRDVQAGAGWGVVDVTGAPKSAYFALQRASQPIALLLSDDRLDGLTATVHNEVATTFRGSLEIRILHLNGAVDSTEQKIEVPGRHSEILRVDGMVDVFSDLTNAYRFGPARVDVVHVSLLDLGGARVSEAYHFPAGQHRPVLHGAVLSADVHFLEDGVDIEVSASALSQFVSIEVDGCIASDNWFHLEPNGRRKIHFRPRAVTSNAARGHVRALNVADAVYFSETRAGS